MGHTEQESYRPKAPWFLSSCGTHSSPLVSASKCHLWVTKDRGWSPLSLEGKQLQGVSKRLENNVKVYFSWKLCHYLPLVICNGLCICFDGFCTILLRERFLRYGDGQTQDSQHWTDEVSSCLFTAYMHTQGRRTLHAMQGYTVLCLGMQ